ncbi:MAG: SLC13 family permease [Geminicoccaceae bacterium]|nr:SLC13 family permease [Geminicoccaceae bacterium]
MTFDQSILFAILGFVFVFLLWGRWRYDIVAFSALVIALLFGVVATEDAFSGFGHPATVIIALVLIVSRGLANSGAIELLARLVVDSARGLAAHIGIMGTLAAALSAVMNNVAALALLMPIDLQAAKNAKRSPSLSLMPLSFASILGGLVTLIGTPPNIVISAFRESALGEPFAMFDFAPVGVVCAVTGLLFIVLGGWRLIPRQERSGAAEDELSLGNYIAELRVRDSSKYQGSKLADLQELVDDDGVTVIGLVRRGQRLAGYGLQERIEERDIIVVEASAEAIDGIVGKLGLEYFGTGKDEKLVGTDDLQLTEVVVPEGAPIEGRSSVGLSLISRFGVHLLGIRRQGRRFRERVRRLQVEAGDVLLFLGPAERMSETVAWLGCLPLAERGLTVVRRDKAWLAVGMFAAAILLASFGVLYLAVALAGVAVLMVLANIVPPREIYTSIEWPVIVLLGSMIPIGAALETSGGTALIAGWILDAASGQSAVVVLVLLMVVTMTLSDIMNNTATAVIAAPIAVDIAGRLGVNADPFLMAIAVAASCAFLTPIGHKNNMLVMGPGGYRFGDYWRLGLPLEILIVAVGVPMILLVWPL